MILAGHQPEYLPYIGLIYKILKADAFMFADNLQFKKKNFQNRNRIKTKDGFIWLNVPVHCKGEDRFKNINEIKIKKEENWQEKHWRAIEASYKNAPFFNDYAEHLKEIYEQDWDILGELNIALTKKILEILGVQKRIFIASEHGVTGGKNDYIANMCKAVGADTYLHGKGGKEGSTGESYIDTKHLENLGVKSLFSDFEHPLYKQRWKPFTKNMSVIDLIFMEGPKSLEIILNSGNSGNTKKEE